ncbi:MAG: c-type cytochrome domain-containing protein [Planctomycetia bacterium]
MKQRNRRILRAGQRIFALGCVAAVAILVIPVKHGTMAHAAGPQPQPEGFFRDRVAPLLAARCGACHGPNASESGFRIDTREHALRGGDSGTADREAEKRRAGRAHHVVELVGPLVGREHRIG